MTDTPTPAPSLTLDDLLVAAQLDPAEVLLIRHPLSHRIAREAVESGRLREYTSEQWEKFPSRHRYWLTFLGEEGASARYVICYENGGRDSEGAFLLTETPILADLAWRLIIDWGVATRIWRQNGVTARKKPVLAIVERAVDPFPGFENIVLSFAQLERVVAEPRRYALWHAALAAINGVYLIVDTHTGKQYVGSAYGDGGLLGRWKVYIQTFHGGNKRLVAELGADPSTFNRFQFSILQILPRSTTPEAVVAVETLYKNKLLTKQFGLNAN